MEENTNSNKPGSSKNNQYLLLTLVVVVVVIVLAAVLLTHKSNKTSTTSTPPSSTNTGNTAIVEGTSLSLSPSSQTVAKDSTLTLEVWEDSLSTKVNAVQANFTYPTDKLTFVGIDDSSSAFSIKAQASGDAGKVQIGRGTVEPVSGKQLIAKVNFTAANPGKATLSFSSGTALLSSTNNKNIVANKTGGSYTIQ